MENFRVDLTKLLVSKKDLVVIMEDKFLGWSLRVSFFMIFLQLAAIGLFWRFIPPQVPIFYSHPWGQEQLADKKMLFILPGSLLFLSAVNLYLGGVFLYKEKLLVRVFIFSSSLLVFLLTISLYKILSLTTF